MKEKNNIDRFDIETLACTIMGLDIDEMEYEEGKVEELFYEHFGFDLDIFETIISKLIPLIDF